MLNNETVVYKDVSIPKNLAGLITHMKSVEDYREELRILAGQWDLLTILGQISGTGTNMTGTREGFKHLTSELLSQLGLENLKKASQEIGSKAQVAVDIVIRNLFERTADIGFLATDDDIRNFIKDLQALQNMPREECDEKGINKNVEEEKLISAMKERFEEYTKKYSVYFDIVLMDTDGNILVRMDDSVNVKHSKDEIIYESLHTDEEYVEVFREADFLPGKGESLIYAYRVSETNDAKSKKLGVLALCFRFKNEMEGIFKNLTTDGDWSVICLLDKSGRAIASSCGCQVPVGSQLEMMSGGSCGLTRFAGKMYFAKTCPTKGYQGFRGLGWYGHVMIPIEHAFETGGEKNTLDAQVLKAVMKDPKLFSRELKDIPVQADKIQSELERTVWNGNITGNDAKSKILLWNISDAGAKTKKVFQESIDNLHETVISSVLNDVWFWAALSVDIMDRNLYERANDCRWWALTSAFRTILKSEYIDSSNAAKMHEILKYINNLYTVYTNLFLYDKHGKIVAVSSENEEHLVGRNISESWVRETLSLKDSQKYSVSDFQQSEFYSGRHTYIYGASVTDIDTGDVLGGIGIVFDSEPQFKEMLEDSLPRNSEGEVPEGCFAVFTDRKGSVISSTSESLTPGAQLQLEAELFKMPCGEGTSRIVDYEGHYYAVGAHAGAGYREYKTTDCYTNDVIGFIFIPLAQVMQEDAVEVFRKRELRIDARGDKDTDTVEIATFFIGNRWLGLRTEYVLEAVQPEGITHIPGSCSFMKGQIIYDELPMAVLDIRQILNEPERPVTIESQIVVVQAENVKVGLLVDGLGEIPEIDVSRIEEPDCVIEETRYTDCIVKPEVNSANQDMLVVLHPQGLISFIKEQI